MIPKYILKEINEGRFSEFTSYLRNFERYTFVLLVDDRSIEKAATLAEKISSWAKRNMALSKVGTIQKCWVKQPGDKLWELVECIPIGITDPVAKELEDAMEDVDYQDRVRINHYSSVALCKENFFAQDESMKICHLRADFSYRWSSSWFIGKQHNKRTPAEEKEITRVCNEIVDHLFPNGIRSINDFNSEQNVAWNPLGEYNYFFKGCLCNYWIRCITRKGDYNLYIKCYKKGV